MILPTKKFEGELWVTCDDAMKAQHEAVQSAVAAAKESRWLCCTCGSTRVKGYAIETDCGPEHDAYCEDCGSGDVGPLADCLPSLIAERDEARKEREDLQMMVRRCVMKLPEGDFKEVVKDYMKRKGIGMIRPPSPIRAPEAGEEKK